MGLAFSIWDAVVLGCGLAFGQMLAELIRAIVRSANSD